MLQNYINLNVCPILIFNKTCDHQGNMGIHCKMASTKMKRTRNVNDHAAMCVCVCVRVLSALNTIIIVYYIHTTLAWRAASTMRKIYEFCIRAFITSLYHEE